MAIKTDRITAARVVTTSLVSALLGFTALPVVAGPGEIVASASKNTIGIDTHSSLGVPATVSAVWNTGPGYAHAESSRTSIEVISNSQGSLTTEAMAASGSVWSNYSLWDIANNAAAANGGSYTLSFNFHLYGSLSVPPSSVSTASVSYDATLYSTGYQQLGAHFNSNYGPISPFPSEGYVNSGDATLSGTFDSHFSLTHNAQSTGLLTLGLQSGASGAGYSAATLVLDSVTLASGTAPAGGLGIRIGQTGQVIQVTAVPEPETYAMLLAGLGLLGFAARRKAGG